MLEQVSKTEFKARALEFFRKVEASGESVIITDHGTPTIEVKVFHPKKMDPLKMLKGSVVEYIDPMEPVGLLQF